MDVFISWSGEKSRVLAEKLRDWIPLIVQAANPWVSAKDIEAGTRWASEVGGKLSQAHFGIICLTRANQHAAWLAFEAGALAKVVDQSRVCPYLIDLKPTEITGPLAMFQSKMASREETLEVLMSVNNALGDHQQPEERIKKLFDTFWPELEAVLSNLPVEATASSSRTEKEMIEEVLGLVRGLSRRDLAVELAERFVAREAGTVNLGLPHVASTAAVFSPSIGGSTNRSVRPPGLAPKVTISTPVSATISSSGEDLK